MSTRKFWLPLPETEQVKSFLANRFEQCKTMQDLTRLQHLDCWNAYKKLYANTQYKERTFRNWYWKSLVARKNQLRKSTLVKNSVKTKGSTNKKTSKNVKKNTILTPSKLVRKICSEMSDAEIQDCKPAMILAKLMEAGYEGTTSNNQTVIRIFRQERLNRGFKTLPSVNNFDNKETISRQVREYLSKFNSSEILEINSCKLFRKLREENVIPFGSKESNVTQILRLRKIEARYEIEIENLKNQLNEIQKSQPVVSVTPNGSVRDMVMHSFEVCRGDIDLVKTELSEQLNRELDWLRRMQKIVNKT